MTYPDPRLELTHYTNLNLHVLSMYEHGVYSLDWTIDTTDIPMMKLLHNDQNTRLKNAILYNNDIRPEINTLAKLLLKGNPLIFKVDNYYE